MTIYKIIRCEKVQLMQSNKESSDSGIPSKTTATTNFKVNTTSTVANTTNIPSVKNTNVTTTTKTTTTTPSYLIDDKSSYTTLPSFEDDTGPKSIKLPVPLYELPNENLLDTRYKSTTNHYWSFKIIDGNSIILDRAPKRNILTNSIYRRLSQFDNKLIESNLIYTDLNNEEKVLFTSLNGTLPSGSLSTPGIQQKKRSVYINSNENQSCICLLNDTNRERYYFRQCLLDANECDYGLSLSIWLQFTTEILYSKEIILSTAPENGKGFTLSIINGMLEFELRSIDTLWMISAPITKELYQWYNIGVAWGKSTQSIKLVINGNMVAMKNNYEGDYYPGTDSTPTSIWIGCSVGSDGQTITSSINPGIKVATVALWYWPIQLDELFSGDQEYYLLTHEVVTKPPVTEPVQSNYADYTNEVEELTPADEISEILNPVYLIADYYNPLLQLPENYTQDDITLISDRSTQKTAYHLSSAESCYELELFNVLTCPGNIHLCTQGLSIGVWLNVPNNLNTTVGILDILEFVNGISVSVYNNYINIFINSIGGLVVFRVYNVIPRDIWFNLGISISNFINTTVDVYFNGITMVVEQVMPPATTPLKRTDQCSKGLILGSSKSGRSAAGIAYSDFILWYRWLYSFESHLFVGYTSAQQANLHNSSYYWTPDPYIAYDSDVQIQVRQKYNYFRPENDYSLTGIPGYSLASIYISKFVTFRFNQDDYENKSKVPVFEMKPRQYMMLGLRKSSEVLSTNLVWNGECLIEPSLTACNAHGFSLSMWIKLLSVSQNRLRFYLNSGDSGTSSSTMSYYRGISIFTDTSLIGVSISQFSLTWQLILDSSSYKVGQWINIGILWRGDVGLTLLLDGVNYGSILSNGQKVYKPRKSPPYLILGRFNTDQETTWLSPSDADEAAKENNNNQPQWEMSHYTLGDIAYFNRLLSHKEYNEQIGLLNIPYLRDVIGNVWFGKNMISPPLSQIIKAVSRNISKPGPIFNSSLSNSVLLLRNPEVVQLTGGGSLRLGIFEPNTCPFNLQNCQKGLSIGGWYRFGGYFTKPNENQLEPIILFTGLGGNYGLTLSYNGALLGGWLQYEITLPNETIIHYSWKCLINNLQIGLNQKNMQWIHLSLIWTGITNNNNNENTLQLLINGLIVIKCNQNTHIIDLFYQKWIDYAINKSKNLFIQTNTQKQSYLLISSQTNNINQQITFSIALLVLQPKFLMLTNLMNLMGIEYYEILELLYSSFYWQISGYLNQLTPYRIQLMNAQYGRDQYDSPMGALCTQGNEVSYLIFNGDKIMPNGGDITNLYESCLYDPSTCQRYAISFRFNLLNLPNTTTTSSSNNNSNFAHEILRTTPIGSSINTVGLLMYLSSDYSRLIVEIRSQIITSRNSIKFNPIQQLNKWINMQIFYYQDRPLTIHIDGNLLSSIDNATYIHEINAKLSNEMRLKQNLIIGRGLNMCISSMTLYDMSSDNDFNLLVSTTNSKICYTNMDMFEALDGTIIDHNNRTNSALQLMNSTKILSFSMISCLHNPDICNMNGMTMSMWIMINGFVNEAGEMLTMKNNENLTAVILSTGPPQNVGILIQAKGQYQDGKLRLSLITSIYTQHYLWSVESNNALKPGQWTNIAFSWFSQPEENTGSLDVYIDGIRKHSSTMPVSMLNMNVEMSDTSKIFIGSAFYNTTDYTQNPSKTVFATGGISKLAYWESKNVISCSKPRKTKKFLRGDCESDINIPETITCIMLQGCRQADGSVCMDQTMPNIIRMANLANRLTYPSEFLKLLQISTELLRSYNTYQTTDENISSFNNNSNINDVPNLITSIMSITDSWSKSLITLPDNIDQSIINEIISIQHTTQLLITDLIELLLSSDFNAIWLQLLQQSSLQYNELLPKFNQILLFIAKVNAHSQLNVCNTTIMKSRNNFVASYTLNIQFNAINNCSIDKQNSLTLNTSFLTNSNNEIWCAQFKLKVVSNKNQQNLTFNKILSILTIINDNNENLLIGDISLHEFSNTTQQQNYADDNKQNKLYNNDTEQIDRIFRIVSPIYSVEYYAGNQVDTTITNSNNNNSNNNVQLSFSLPLLRFNKYQSVYYYETTWRMKWKAYKAEQYHEDQLANEIRCVYLNNQFDINGKWDTNGCQIVKAEISQVQCVCTHLSVFAVAMESEDASYRSIPIWKVWGLETESQCSMIINIIIYGGNGLSLVCSLLFLITLIIVRKSTSIQDIYLTRIGLCLCQIGFHATLFIEPLMNKYQIPCQAIGVSLNLFTILVSSWLTNEAFSLFKSFVLGRLKLTYCWAWTMGIVVPLALTLIPTITSKFRSQGGDLFCLPSRESLEFWIMFGSMFAYTIVTIMVCFTLTCNVETPAFLQPKLLDKLLTRVKNLNSLVIYHTLSWSLFVLVIKVAIPKVVFIAFALVSLQGTWSFIIYGLQDRELFKTCLKRKRKQHDIVGGTGILLKNPLIINEEKDAFRMGSKNNNSLQDNNTVVSLQKKDATNDAQIHKRK
ncbi:Cadherin EGF LAG seven-pass G-type receptor 1 [Schistosoma japonicum]|nr:Cadherin EGF LAG seven-pass G-type receptor 1 [Schistosoma japonicum]